MSDWNTKNETDDPSPRTTELDASTPAQPRRYHLLTMFIVGWLLAFAILLYRSSVNPFSDIGRLIMYSLGQSAAIFGIAWIIVLIPVGIYWLFKRRPIPGFHIAMWVVWGLITIMSHVGMAETLQAEVYGPDGCDFNVLFPDKPSYQTMYAPTAGKFVQAQLKSGEGTSGYVLRAECIPVTKEQHRIMDSEEYMLQRAVSYATPNGIQNAEYRYEASNFGHKVTLRGFKTIGGAAATYEVQTYLGSSSFLSLHVASASTIYPPPGAIAFFKSVERK